MNCSGKNVLLALKGMFLGALIFTGGGKVSGADFRINKTSMKIGSGATLMLKNNLSVASDALVKNTGNVYFHNANEATLSLNTILDGSGIYNVTGTADVIINGVGAAVSSLSLNGSNSVFVEDDLIISSQLVLNTGILNIAENSDLRIANASAEAITFDSGLNNTSYITGNGRLVRNTVTGSEYSFPWGVVGSGFHPLKIGSLSAAGNVAVSFLPSYVNDFNAANSQVHLENVGAWQVETSSEAITFTPFISLYESGSTLSDWYSLFYASSANLSSDFYLDNRSAKNSQGYLTSSSPYHSGLFAASFVETVTGEDDDFPKMVNFIVLDGSGRTTFEVPGLESYRNVELSMYDRFGNLIYRSTDYANDFDCRDYLAGTYFYELTLITQEGTSLLGRNIIEIVEHN